MNISNKGFAPIIVLIVALLAAGLGGYIYFRSQDKSTINTTTTVPESAIITTTTILATTKDWTCGDSVTFTYKKEVVTYGTVESQGRCWLDRNLGASRVATAFDDSEAYGDLFQWGRGDDGHQDRKSKVTTILSKSDNPGHSNFIGVAVGNDWRLTKNNDLWQGASGINNPCPNGWRLPTSDEWDIERLSWFSNNAAGAFASFLKLTAAGARHYDDLPFKTFGFNGGYRSSTVGGYSRSAFILNFYEYSVLPPEMLIGVTNTDDASLGAVDRATGYSVRCIKD